MGDLSDGHAEPIRIPTVCRDRRPRLLPYPPAQFCPIVHCSLDYSDGNIAVRLHGGFPAVVDGLGATVQQHLGMDESVAPIEDSSSTFGGY